MSTASDHAQAGAMPGWAKLTYADPADPWLRRLLIEVLERATGRPLIERLYNEIRDLDVPAGELWGLGLRQLGIAFNYDPASLASIPAQGPLVLVANHPFGVVDGLMLAHLASRVREDYFLLVNEVLARDPRLNAHLLPVDFRDTKAAVLTNVDTGRRAVQRVLAGGAMAIFPSGGVATAPTAWGRAVDLPWKPFAAKIIQQSRATVVPIYFSGQNSRLFQVVSQFSMPLRLGLLLQETRNKMGRTFEVRIGEPISFEALAQRRDRHALMAHLREAMLSLGAEG